MPKIVFMVFILMLLPGCGAKGSLFLAEPTSEQPKQATDTDPKADPEAVDPQENNHQTTPKKPISALQRSTI